MEFPFSFDTEGVLAGWRKLERWMKGNMGESGKDVCVVEEDMYLLGGGRVKFNIEIFLATLAILTEEN